MGDPESHNYDVESEEHISFAARNAIPKAVTLYEIESATAKDIILQAVMSAVKSGCWHKVPLEKSLSDLSDASWGAVNMYRHVRCVFKI